MKQWSKEPEETQNSNVVISLDCGATINFIPNSPLGLSIQFPHLPDALSYFDKMLYQREVIDLSAKLSNSNAEMQEHQEIRQRP